MTVVGDSSFSVSVYLILELSIRLSSGLGEDFSNLYVLVLYTHDGIFVGFQKVTTTGILCSLQEPSVPIYRGNKWAFMPIDLYWWSIKIITMLADVYISEMFTA